MQTDAQPDLYQTPFFIILTLSSERLGLFLSSNYRLAMYFISPASINRFRIVVSQ